MFQNCITEVIDRLQPLGAGKCHQKKNWITNRIKNLRAKRNLYRNRRIKTNLDSDKDRYFRFRNPCTQQIRESKKHTMLTFSKTVGKTQEKPSNKSIDLLVKTKTSIKI